MNAKSGTARVLAALSALALLAGCSANTASSSPPVSQTPAIDASNNGTLAGALAQLGPELLLQLRKDGAEGDLVVSPFSVYAALAMTRLGAQGETLAEMERVLHISQVDPAVADQAYNDFLKAVSEQVPPLGADQSGTPLQFQSANALWVGEGLKLKQPFLDASSASYAARAESVDFASPDTVAMINDWVGGQTKGKIPSLLDSLDPATRMVLTNALYLKGSWATPFDPSLTTDAPFKLADGSSVQLPTMQGRFESYYAGETYEAVIVPMLGGDMVLYLPKKGHAPDDVLAELAAKGANEPVWETVTGTLYLPRFKAEWKDSLAGPLQALGMRTAFGSDADFSALSDELLSVSDVIHAATTEVDENGIEAAAATAVVMMRGMPAQGAVEVRFDRSFVYTVRAAATPLFYGVVEDPR